MQLLKSLLNHTTSPEATSDDEAELLRQLRSSQREVAFQTIVTRYGALVWSVCRRQQLRVSDAEDVFQATFLVLLEQAHTIRQASLSSWLYGVAWRISAKLKRQLAREQARLQRVAIPEAQYASDALSSEELSKLDEAIQHLPDIYREPVIRCCLLGQSQSSVSQSLGWPLGTVAGRLARAKELLRTRLARQGIAPAALAALGADVQAVPVAVLQPALDLLHSTHTTRVIDMTRWIPYSSFPSKLFYISMAAVLMVVGTGWLAYSQATPPQDSKASPVTNMQVDLKADRNAMQGAWIRDIHHDITGAKVAVEELVIKK